jgi:hypothetical protein
VWVGNPDGTPMIGTSGLTGAAPIWNTVMTGTLQGTPPHEFPVPDTVTQATYCADWGTADFAECVNRGTEIFFNANPPPSPDTVVQTLPIDQFSGLVANENCPDYVENRTFLSTSDATAINWLNSTAEGQAWAQQRNLSLPIQAPPTSACQPGQPRPNVAITNPPSGGAVSGLVEIFGIAFAPGFNYEIQVASAANPGAFQTVDGPFSTQSAPGETFLGRWNAQSLPAGQYILKLRLSNQEGRVFEITSPVNLSAADVGPAAFPTATPGGPIVIPGFPTATPGFGVLPGFPTATSGAVFPWEATPQTGFPTAMPGGTFPTPTPGSGGISIFPPTTSP